MKSLKKIIGSLGQKYGGKAFLRFRDAVYKFWGLCNQLYEIYYLRKGTYAPRHKDSLFYRKYYKEASHKAEGHKTGERIVVCMCDGRRFHGGPTDRLRGILTTYREAKKRKLPFFISWTEPFQLEKYLVPASTDWRIKASDLKYTVDEAFPVIIEDETNLQSYLRMKAGFNNRLNQLHFYSNADNAIGEYRELFAELFKPSPDLARNVSSELDAIGSPYWAFTFRFLNLLGDFKEWSRKTLSSLESELLIGKCIEEILTLAEEMPVGYKILVTSDSHRFLDIVKKGLDKRIYVVEGDVKNIDLLKGEYPEAWMKTFVDQQLLMKAEKVHLMRTGGMYKSGFPRFAAEVGGVEFIDHVF